MRKPKPEANTFLNHFFTRGLADERYEVKRYKSADGDIRPSLRKSRRTGHGGKGA